MEEWGTAVSEAVESHPLHLNQIASVRLLPLSPLSSRQGQISL